ncbi:MAG: DUF2214 family protein [Pseudomonadales bacterium]|nr:DUF2214 family protein [Pseudomonadales bacterium]
MAELLFRSLHILVALALVGSVLIQNLALSAQLSVEDTQNLRKINKIFGMTAALVLGLGLVLLMGVGSKPAAFYGSNPVFHAKMGLFVLLAVLVVPTTRFLKRATADADGNIALPGGIRLCFRLQLTLALIIPVLAYLMARGIGITAN